MLQLGRVQNSFHLKQSVRGLYFFLDFFCDLPLPLWAGVTCVLGVAEYHSVRGLRSDYILIIVYIDALTSSDPLLKLLDTPGKGRRKWC